MDKPIPEAVAQLRRLADVIRRHGTIPSLSLEHIADALTAAQQQGQAVFADIDGAIAETESTPEGRQRMELARKWALEALSQPMQQRQAVALDRMAIRLLVEAGFVTEDKANEALRIAHGFDKGPLAPQPMQQGSGPSAYCLACEGVGMQNCAHFNECAGATCITCHRPLNAAPPSAPVGVSDSMLERAWKAAAAACVSVRGGKHTYVAPVSPSDWYAALRPALETALAQQPAAVTQPDGGDVSNGSQQPAAVDGAGHQYAQSAEHGNCAHCGYPEHETMQHLAAQPGGSDNGR